jgi:hypothetical protein
MTRHLVLVAAASIILAATSQMPATLGPPVTGSVYDGNNAHPPDLRSPQPAEPTSPAAPINGQEATGGQTHGQ